MLQLKLIPIVIAFTLFACDDTSVPASTEGGTQAGSTAGTQAGTQAGSTAGTQAGSTAGTQAGSTAGATAGNQMTEDEIRAKVAFVEAKLIPQKLIYDLSEHPKLEVKLFDRIGQELPSVSMRYTPRPDNSVVVNVDETLSFITEGQGALRICANADICGRVSFVVDNAPPVITLESPTDGQVIEGEPTILVKGKAEGAIKVLINDQEVLLSRDGSFEKQIPAIFGYNSVLVSAEDGIRDAKNELRTAVYAPVYLPLNDQLLSLDQAFLISIRQSLLDSDQPLPQINPDMPLALVLNDVASLLELLIRNSNPSALISQTVISNSDTFSLSIANLNIGQPQIDMLLGRTGFELFLSLDQLSFDTTGFLMFEGLNLSLDGTIRLDASAFASLEMAVDDQGHVRFNIADVGVTLETLRGNMQDQTAQALLDTISSVLEVAIRNWTDANLQNMVTDALPSVINDQINQSLDSLKQIPLSFPTIGTGMINLEAGFQLNAPSINERNRAMMSLSLGIERFNDSSAPQIDLPGLPAHEVIDTSELFAQTSSLSEGDFTLAIPLTTINSILYQTWAQGALDLDVSDQVPMGFQAFIKKVVLNAKLPPLIVPAPQGSPYQVLLRMENLELTLEDATGMKKDIHRLSVEVGLGFAVENQQLKLSLPNGASIKFAQKTQLGPRPVVDTIVLNQALNSLIWPQLQATIGSGLSVAIPSLTQDLGSLGFMGNLMFSPVFPNGFKVRDGYMILDGQFEFSISN
jgi:hypothetical protein